MRVLSQRTGLRIYGPNRPGLNNINARLGMTFSPAFRLDLRPSTRQASGDDEGRLVQIRYQGRAVIEVDDLDEVVDVVASLSRRQPTGREKVAVYYFSGGTAAFTAD